MKHKLSLYFALCAASLAWGNPNWKMHNTFDEEVKRLIDTDNYTYFISRTQPYNSKVTGNQSHLFSLFRYDKEADELLALSTDNLLSANVVSCVEYCPEKKMLVVVYSNHDIDLVYDNGKVANIPAYKFADIASGKDVNSIFVDVDADRIYLSTGFGYVALNDKKLEVAESRMYGTPVLGMSRLGNDLLLLMEDGILMAPVSAPRYNLSDYEKVSDLTKGVAIARLADDRSLVIDTSGSSNTISLLERVGEEVKLNHVSNGSYVNMHYNPAGLVVTDHNWVYQFYPDGHRESIFRMEEDRRIAAGSHDMNEIWYGKLRKGITSKRYSPDSDSKWTLTRDYMAPDAPSPYKATKMVWHKDYGLLVANHGYDNNFTNHSINSPILLSGYKDGRWTNYSPVYTWPEGKASLMNPNGLAIDPDNPDLVYFGSLLHGIERINMKDGSDILHLSRTNDPFRNEPGYVEIIPDQQGKPSPALGGANSWTALSMFSAPEFDAYGNMWTAHCDWDDQTPLQVHIFCWEAANRRASVDASSYRPMEVLKIPGLPTNNFQFVKPLTTTANRDIVLWTNTAYAGDLVLIHTNGTPTDGSDDKVVRLSTYTDQDGVTFDVHYVTAFYEDPLTGNVWVGHGEGVFYFNPKDILAGKERVYRVKVARNDGTNLADYLLNLVKVNNIAVDGSGRKWFATAGAGVVCTSSDGRVIEEELTTENSMLPDDMVYGLGYIPTTNSMLFSTDLGMAEYFLSSASGSGDDMQARAYPNPVRPDYFGYVTIDGVAEGSLVKIVDSRGNLVKELGHIVGGEAKWDVTDMSFRRVGSGVYFILTSTDENSGKLANVGKILVVN